jgi:hypothetical protein
MFDIFTCDFFQNEMDGKTNTGLPLIVSCCHDSIDNFSLYLPISGVQQANSLLDDLEDVNPAN